MCARELYIPSASLRVVPWLRVWKLLTSSTTRTQLSMTFTCRPLYPLRRIFRTCSRVTPPRARHSAQSRATRPLSTAWNDRGATDADDEDEADEDEADALGAAAIAAAADDDEAAAVGTDPPSRLAMGGTKKPPTPPDPSAASCGTER